MRLNIKTYASDRDWHENWRCLTQREEIQWMIEHHKCVRIKAVSIVPVYVYDTLTDFSINIKVYVKGDESVPHDNIVTMFIDDVPSRLRSMAIKMEKDPTALREFLEMVLVCLVVDAL